MQEIKQEKSQIKQKILLYLSQQGVSPYEFYKKTGVTRGILTQNNGINEDNLARFLAYAPDISLEWLLMGEGEMLKSSVSNGAEESKGVAVASANAPQPTPKGLPLIPIDAVAGFNGWDEAGVTSLDCTRYDIPDFEAAHADFLIRVSGSSMYPKYSSGDILACRRIDEITFIQWGKIYVIDSRQGAMVKRLFPIDGDDDNIQCRSDNPNYPPFCLPKAEIRSLSIVVGAIRLE